MATAPTNIRVNREEQEIEFSWANEQNGRMPFRYLRGRCPCAGCVNEFTGERMVHIEDIPEGIEIVDVRFTGNYALKIVWSDSHDTGLFTWEYLSELCVAEDNPIMK